MSMKSFDKFCENIILGEPASQKEIFDERQKQQRTQLTVEALIVYAVMSAIAVMLNEIGYQWCEGNFELMVLCMALCLLWWVIRNASKGSLFGVSGKGTLYSAIISLIWVPYYISTFFLNPERAFAVVRSGMLSNEFVVSTAFVFYFAAAFVTLILKIRENKREKSAK